MEAVAFHIKQLEREHNLLLMYGKWSAAWALCREIKALKKELDQELEIILKDLPEEQIKLLTYRDSSKVWQQYLEVQEVKRALDQKQKIHSTS